MIEALIKKLGFKASDIKLLLTCHAHIDHVGGHAYIKKISGADVAIINMDADLLISGGKADFHCAGITDFEYQPVNPDRIFRDGDTLTLGEVELTALLTAGHSKGSTTWIANVVDGGQNYAVDFPDGSGVNPGFRVAKNPSHPGSATTTAAHCIASKCSSRTFGWKRTEMFDFEGHLSPRSPPVNALMSASASARLALAITSIAVHFNSRVNSKVLLSN